MDLIATLQILREASTDKVVLTSMASGREWQQFDPRPLDFVQIPSSMGQTQSWGLGIALAQPYRRVVVCCGDGSLLMNLGSLITIANIAPPNFTLLVFDNGVYEVTGGQPTPASTAGRSVGRPVDLASIAQHCGFRHTEHLSTLNQWRERADDLLNRLGPVCAVLDVSAVTENFSVRAPGRNQQRVKEFAAALRASPV